MSTSRRHCASTRCVSPGVYANRVYANRVYAMRKPPSRSTDRASRTLRLEDGGAAHAESLPATHDAHGTTHDAGVDRSDARSAARRATPLAAVSGVAHVLARGLEGAALVEALAQVIGPLVGAELALVATVHDGDISTLAGNRQLDDPRTAAVLRTIMNLAALRRQHLVAGDPFALVPGTFTTPASLGWSSLAVIPAVHHAGQTTAVVLVASRAADAFDAEDVVLLDTIAEQMLVGLDRAQLVGRLGEWSNGLEALLAFSASVHGQRAPAILVNEMVEHAARFLKADGGRGGLVTVDADGTLAMESTAYLRQGTWRPVARRWRTREGIPGRVLDHEFAYLVPDYPNDPAADPELVDEGLVRHALGVPLRDTAREVIGFLELHRDAERAAFSWDDAAFLESLADTTAMAIENSRLVTALEAKNDEVRQLFARHAERLEEERQHVARELHDETGQALVGVKLALQSLTRVMPPGNPAVTAPLDELRLQVNQATARLRQLARRLRPPTLDQHGLAAALQQLAHDTEQRSGAAVRVTIDAQAGERWPLQETAVFRVVQEALTNAVGHGQATHVTVEVAVTAHTVAVRVHDDGRGFAVDKATDGLGLRGIRERVHQLGGAVRLESTPGHGTTVAVDLPLR